MADAQGLTTGPLRAAVVTTSRADWGIWRPVMHALLEDVRFDAGWIVTGSHLLAEHGMSIEHVRTGGGEIWAQFECLEPQGQDAYATARAMGRAVTQTARWMEQVKPDVVCVLGDRFEMFAVASALVPFRVPVVHVHGGELTFGAIDDLFRHAMTKLSHLHMTSTEAYRHRVIQMGEAPWRVHAVGAPALDGILASANTPEDLADWDLPEEPFALVTYHPETQLDDAADDAMLEAMLEALSRSPLHVIITAPNADPRGQGVRARLERFVSEHAQRARLVANFGIPTYYHVMRRACCMVGNSSSGILEAASFGLPVVNLGGRQQGRLSAENVLTVTHASARKIGDNLTQAQDARWRASLASMSNPYGDGHAAGRIVEAMAQGLERPDVTRKIFEDLNFSLNS